MLKVSSHSELHALLFRVYSHRNHDIPLLGALPPGQLFTSYSCWDSRSMPNTVILVLVGASISGHTVARSVVHKTDCVTQDRLNNTSSPQYIHADSQIFFHRGFGCAVSFASSAASSSELKTQRQHKTKTKQEWRLTLKLFLPVNKLTSVRGTTEVL